MPKVQVNDIEMYYEIHGEGPPLLLIHGFTGSSQMWTTWIPDLTPQFQLIIPDLRGHGKTNNPSKTFTHKQAADDVLCLLDHLMLKKIKGFGISSGGDIFLHMSTIQPERVEMMVVDGCGPYFSKQTRQSFRDFTPTEEQMKRYREVHHLGEEQIKLLIKQVKEMKDSYHDMNFTKPLLSTIQAKTLIVYGDRDRYYSVELAVEMYQSIPDSYLWVVPNADHAVSYHSAELVKAGVLDFLTGKWENG
jgi:pimeloyl-ACP methyl ester carboxylesterase